MNVNNLKISTASFLIMAGAAFTGCQPDSFEDELGALPTPAFTATPLASNANSIVFTNTSPDAFLQQWDFGNGSKSTKAKDTIHFVYAGEYNVVLTVFGKGGHKSLTQKVMIASDDPCSNVVLDKLAGQCGSDGKVWRLKPGAGALTVGPPDGGIWWSNNDADANDASRVCMFNDDYKFTRGGQFIFENYGDMRVDDEGGQPWPTDIGLPIGCHDMSAIPAKYHAWGSGTHAFELTATNLKIKGLGAFMGLYKVGENGTTATPEQEINYEILELTNTKLIIRKSYDWGYWKFEFAPKGETEEDDIDKLAGPSDGSGKVWVLKPAAGALTVGPPEGTVWWSNGDADVNDANRVCQFNDDYKFTRDGEFIFENHGDMRVDDEGGNPWPTDIGLAIGCHDMSAIPEKYHAWGSGNHTFELTPTNLKVKGLGAFMGLYKVGENGTTATPEEEINYEILELTSTKLVIRKTYDWGYWKFEFVPK